MSVRTEVKGRAFWITFDNPKRANAISIKIYDELCHAFDAANAHENTIITVVTGVGNYYSSGNDFSPKEMATHDHANLDIEAGYSRFIRRIIMHRKVLIGLVNGPVMGVACTTLGLFDYVVCSDSTYFLCPFTEIGVCCEGVSSVIFERIMGTSNAMEMLLFNEPISAENALAREYVSRIFPKKKFVQRATELVEKYSKLPKHSMLVAKEVCRGQKWRRDILASHNEEYDLLRKLFVDERTIELINRKYDKNKL